ncbi:MAG: isoprenyl transferase [Armatimonadota bacterium]
MNHIMMLDKFTPEEKAIIERLDLTRLPGHIAVIMDGNGRWATEQGLPRVIGHQAGVESIRSLVRTCKDLHIGMLTLYAFSTENWERPGDEVHALMDLFELQLRTEMAHLHGENVRIRHIGRLTGLPASLQGALHDAQELTRDNTALTLYFAINYSGRAELLDAVKTIAVAAAAGRVDPHTLEESAITQALYAPEMPDPDLLIRTAGESRISNYLLWQIAYAEFWFTPTLWPDFRAIDLLQALEEYQHRQRKFGRVTS